MATHPPITGIQQESRAERDEHENDFFVSLSNRTNRENEEVERDACFIGHIVFFLQKLT